MALGRRRLLLSAPALALSARVASAGADGRFPPPSGPPGAPFADPNLKLAVLSNLLDLGAISLGWEEDLAAHVLGRRVDLEDEGWELIPEALDYLWRYPLTPALLAQVRALELDGGNAIYPYAHFFWGGDTEDFDVTTLKGLDYCPNITRVELVSMMAAPADLRHLAGLRHLESVSLGVPFSNPEALLDLPSLRRLRVLDDDLFDAMSVTGHPDRRVMETLRDRGVAVRVQWISTTQQPPPPAWQ